MTTVHHGNNKMVRLTGNLSYIMTQKQGNWFRYPIPSIPVFPSSERPLSYHNGPVKVIPAAIPIRMEQPRGTEKSDLHVHSSAMFHSQGPTQFYSARSGAADSPVDLSLGSSKQKETQKLKTLQPEPLPVAAKPASTGNTKVPTSQISPMQCTYLLCSYCPFKAQSKEEIHSHITSCHPQRVVVVPKTFTCNYCTYMTSSELCMVRHLLTLHRAKILPVRPGNPGTNNLFSCSVCSFSSDEATMIGHMLDHYNNSAPCNKCDSCTNWNQSSIIPTQKRKMPRKTTAANRKTTPRTIASHSNGKAPAKPVLIIRQQPKDVKTHRCKMCSAYFVTQEQLKSHQVFHQNQAVPTPTLPTPTTPSSEQQALNFLKKVTTSASGFQLLPNTSFTLPVSQPVCDVLTPPASECDALTADSSPTSFLPESQAVKKDVMPCLPHNTDAAVANCATSTLVANSTEVVAASAVPSTTSPEPAKKRKLAVKIFKNSSGEYESERSSTPHLKSAPPMEKKQHEAESANPVNLCIQVPLKGLSVFRNLAPKPSKEESELLKLQSPTSLRIPFDSLPNAKKLYEIASRVDQDRRMRDKNPSEDDASFLLRKPTSCPQNSTCVQSSSQNGYSGTRDCGRNTSSQEEVKRELSRQDGDEFGGLPQSGKLMANRLKARLANIHLRSRQSSEPASKRVYSAAKVGSNETKERCVDSAGMSTTGPAGMSSTGPAGFSSVGPSTAKCTSSLFERVLSNDSEAFIDLTLDDSSDEENDEISAASTVGDIASLRRECQVKVTNLSINVEAVRTESTSPTSEKPVEDERRESTDSATNIKSPKDVETGMIVSAQTMRQSKADAAVEIGAGAVETGDVKLMLKPKLARHYKKVRRSACRLPTLPDTIGENLLSSEDLVICPYCPKRLLFRLLPAHVQFHGSDCEHKCRECNFATSFKWVLDTHILCHKDLAPTDARQITEAEWKSLEYEALAGDEELEMTQRLLIREQIQQPPAPLPCKRQTAKKTIAKKTSSAPSSAVIRKLLGHVAAEPVAPVPVNKSKALSTEDFFAHILTERAHYK